MHWRINPSKNWADLEQTFDWVADMSEVPQDPRYHAEGNVAVHTQMVLRELEGLPEYGKLPEEEREMLYAAALLHDVEKRSTTEIAEDGSIRSPRHALRGEYTARQVLYEERPAPMPLREQVAKLVRHHGLPIWVMEKSDPLKALLRCSWELNTRHLYLLCKADILGRISEDQQEFLDRLEFFKAYCQEQDCWGQKRPFANDLAHFNYFQGEGGYVDYVPFDDRKGEVVMLCGLPGAGKDTLVAKHYADWPVVSLDDIRQELGIKPTDSKGQGKVAQCAKERMKEHLRAGRDFVFNATNISRDLRQKNIRLFDTYGFRIRLVYVEVPFSTLVRQNRDREDPVPLKVIRKLMRKLDVPHPTEAHRVDWHFSF